MPGPSAGAPPELGNECERRPSRRFVDEDDADRLKRPRRHRTLQTSGA
jgi:hypothetical protein